MKKNKHTPQIINAFQKEVVIGMQWDVKNKRKPFVYCGQQKRPYIYGYADKKSIGKVSLAAWVAIEAKKNEIGLPSLFIWDIDGEGKNFWYITLYPKGAGFTIEGDVITDVHGIKKEIEKAYSNAVDIMSISTDLRINGMHIKAVPLLSVRDIPKSSVISAPPPLITKSQLIAAGVMLSMLGGAVFYKHWKKAKEEALQRQQAYLAEMDRAQNLKHMHAMIRKYSIKLLPEIVSCFKEIPVDNLKKNGWYLENTQWSRTGDDSSFLATIKNNGGLTTELARIIGDTGWSVDQVGNVGWNYVCKAWMNTNDEDVDNDKLISCQLLAKRLFDNTIKVKLSKDIDFSFSEFGSNGQFDPYAKWMFHTHNAMQLSFIGRLWVPGMVITNIEFSSSKGWEVEGNVFCEM